MTRLHVRALGRSRRLICIMAAAIAAAFVAAVVVGGPVAAHPLSKVKWVYTDQSTCVEGFASLTHGGAHGTTTAYWGPTNSCPSKKSMPPGKIKVRVILSYYNGSSTSICKDTGWKTNSATSTQRSAEKTYSDISPCGPGEYTVTTNAYVKTGGKWRGGDLHPGWHQFGY